MTNPSKRSPSGVLAAALAVACVRTHSPTEPPAPPPITATPTPATPAVAPNTAVATTSLVPESVAPPQAPPEEPAVPETGHAFQEPLPPRDLARDAPAMRAANVSPGACAAELRRRKLPVERDRGPAPGVAVPVRITGEMHGVRFSPPGRKSVYGKLDCRLALALDDFARVLARHGVARVRIDNLYRPRARLPGRRTSSQHRYGLAVDLMTLELASGVELVVERDWRAAPGTPSCGPESRLFEPTPQSIALRDIVCDVARSGIFHHILTPSYDEAHRDHLHLDIKRGEKRWFMR